MSTTKLFNLFALSTLAILFCSLAPSQTLALTVRGNHPAREVPNHHGIARKKRGKRGTQCKPRGTTSPASTPASQPTSTPQSSPSPSNSPSSSSTQPSNPVSTGTSSGKLGIAWALGDDPRFKSITDGYRINRIFLWTSSIPDTVRKSGIATSIILWGTDSAKIQAFQQDIQSGGFVDVRGYNEPNEGGQANIPPETGVQVWRDVILPLRGKGYTISSPATSSNPDGFQWVSSFATQCQECIDSCDTISAHWYDVKVEDLKTYIEKWYTMFGKPIQLTEFACQNFNGGNQPSADDIWAFTVAAVDYLNGNGNVHSYAPFGFMDDLFNVNPANGLLDSNGPNALGSYYLTHS